MRRLLLAAPLALLWALAVAMPDASAFETYSSGLAGGVRIGNCATCHGDFFRTQNYFSNKDGTPWGTTLMTGHNLFLGSDCNACHIGSARSPTEIGRSTGGTGLDPISCIGCHGRPADAQGPSGCVFTINIDPNDCGTGAGLRQHHTVAGITTCLGCHLDANPAAFTAAPESAMPAYYFTPDAVHASKPTNPCNLAPPPGNENKFGPTGLDNDGDGLDDGADLDCAADPPPVADANGPYSGTVGIAVSFDGSGSSDTPPGTIVAYDWDFGDGGTGTGVSPTHTYTASGIYTVGLTVTDDAGGTNSDSTTAEIVEPTDPPPVADANGPYTGTVGSPVQFDGSGSSDMPPGTIVAYDWDFGDGNTGTGVSPSHTYASANVFTVTLTVTDDGTPPLSDSATTTATIDIILPPLADANGPYTGTVGVAVLFDGSGSTDPDGTIVAYDWDFGDGGTGSGVSPSHTYAAAGPYTVTVTVTDDDGLTDFNETTATIGPGPQAPTADANGPYNGTVGVPMTFDGTGSADPDGTIVSYEWDFGDGGTTGSGPTPTHTYASANVFPVTLTVTDDDGLSDSDNTTATITPTCGPPVADPNGPYVGTVGVPVSFDGSGSSDPCGAIVSYDWDFGDGNTESGVNPTHTYATAGLYSVTLTVTNDGTPPLSDSASTTATIGDGLMEVDLKVPRSINPGNNGVTPAGFSVDMMDLEIAMVTCGPDMAEPKRLRPGDFNDDGFLDVGANFITRELGLVCGDTVLTCQGTLADGTPFTATSTPFKTVGQDCRPPKPVARRGR